jgi:hypothetical protein
MATAMRPALLGRALVRAGVCARPTHRSLGERFFRRMLDNPAESVILSTSVDTNTTFVWRTCSHPDLPMPAYARCDIVDEDRVGVYHCIARCVRRAFLCGTDSYTGWDYGHRKAWVLDRLRQLAGLFGVEVCDYAIMSNHLHIVTSQKFARHLSHPATPCRLSGSSLDQAAVCVLVRRIRGFCRSTPKSTSCCSIGPAGRFVRTSAGQSRTTWLRSSTGSGSIDRIG